MIHAGKVIRSYLQSNNISVVSFAKVIHRSRAAAYKILSSESIHTDVLFIISKEYNHNFFNEMGIYLDNDKSLKNNTIAIVIDD